MVANSLTGVDVGFELKSVDLFYFVVLHGLKGVDVPADELEDRFDLVELFEVAHLAG